MKTRVLEYFPILFYEFIFSQDQISPLCKEIQDKKEIIKKRYNEPRVVDHNYSEPRVVDYCSDYSNPLKLLEYEKLIEEISPKFLPELCCEHVAYWTAIYGEKGYHTAHRHTDSSWNQNENIYDISRCNMSSILYLSDIGHTDFFDPRKEEAIIPALFIPSEMGKMIMFPSHILHRAVPHNKKDKERVVVSSNWQIWFLKENEK